MRGSASAIAIEDVDVFDVQATRPQLERVRVVVIRRSAERKATGQSPVFVGFEVQIGSLQLERVDDQLPLDERPECYSEVEALDAEKVRTGAVRWRGPVKTWRSRRWAAPLSAIRAIAVIGNDEGSSSKARLSPRTPH